MGESQNAREMLVGKSDVGVDARITLNRFLETRV
jgi:hypothetical protein